MCVAMFLFKYLWIIFTFEHYVWTSNCNEISATNPFWKEGYRLEAFIFDSIPSPSITQCAKHCILRKLCLSFNFNEVIETCEFNDGTNISLLQQSTSYVYSTITTWSTDLALSCADRPCALEEVCMPMDSAYKCIQSHFSYNLIFLKAERNKWKTFESPLFPKNYPANAYYRWYVEATQKTDVIEVVGKSFEMERLCLYDNLTASEGNYFYGQWCHTTVPRFVSKTQAIVFRFISDSAMQYKGFQISYRSTRKG